jgi:proline iminopeptidase
MTLQRREVLTVGAAGLLCAAMPARSSVGVHTPVAKEGFVAVSSGRIWWRSVGSGSRTPLLLLHGGPGAGHDYLESLGALAADRPVIFYDQLGCGRSDKPDDASLWRIGHFVGEIDALRRALKLDRVALYGHSWGGWLAQEYLRRSSGAKTVDRLVLASTSGSVAEFVTGTQRLLAALPAGMDARRRQLEAAGQMDSPEYAKIVEIFYDRHIVHVDQPPAYLTRTFENLGSSRTYPVMNGPNEFSVTGTLKGWDARSALADIRVPTLVLTSEWDEVTLDCHQRLHQAIRGSALEMIPGARHLAMIEQPERYAGILRQFLAADRPVTARRAPSGAA